MYVYLSHLNWCGHSVREHRYCIHVVALTLANAGEEQRREDMTSCHRLHSKGKNCECKLLGWLYGLSHDGHLVFSTKLSHLASQNWL